MARRPPAPIWEVYSAVVNETDRGCVLVSAAWMDDWLGTSIEIVLHKLESRAPNRLTNNQRKGLINSVMIGCLENAMNRVDFCRCIGLIDNDERSALRALFQLRNRHFGHFAGVSRLTDPEVKDLLDNYFNAINPNKGCKPGHARLYPAPAQMKQNTRKHSKIRRKFVFSTMALSALLSEAFTSYMAISHDGDQPENPLPSK